MKTKKNLVLLGMMGSGKSTIGSLIAIKLNMKFIDIDKIIENEVSMKISEIFEKKGEIFFRNLEEKISIKSLEVPNSIISLGGGGFLNEKIRKEILENHLSFWLDWETEILINRIKKSKKRPVVFNFSEDQIKKLIKKRVKLYSKAKFKINCNKLPKTEIIKKIIKLYEKN
tara:strand:+ start:350 stop:862 length:513 start_codon:yes stop_codon:yes gene_type:complete